MCDRNCTKKAKNEQAQKFLARIDLNSSQKCNKMITEAEEKEGRGAEESLSAFPEREKGKSFLCLQF